MWGTIAQLRSVIHLLQKAFQEQCLVALQPVLGVGSWAQDHQEIPAMNHDKEGLDTLLRGAVKFQ